MVDQNQEIGQNVKCYNCGKRGHFKNECRLLKKNGDFKGKSPELINAQGCVVENLSDGDVSKLQVHNFIK